MNQKFEENFKLHYLKAHTAQEYLNISFEDRNKTYYNKQDYDLANTKIIINLNKSIEVSKEAINYEEEMVKYAPDNIHKEYAEALLKVNKESLKLNELLLQYFALWVWPGTVTDETKAKQLLSEMNTTQDNIKKLEEQKDKIKLQNPALSKQIEELMNESDRAIT